MIDQEVLKEIQDGMRAEGHGKEGWFDEVKRRYADRLKYKARKQTVSRIVRGERWIYAAGATDSVDHRAHDSQTGRFIGAN